MMFGLLYCDVFWLSLCVFFVALNDNFKAGLLATYLSMHLTNSHPYKNWHKPKMYVPGIPSLLVMAGDSRFGGCEFESQPKEWYR